MDEPHGEPHVVVEPELIEEPTLADGQKLLRMHKEAAAILSESPCWIVVAIDSSGRQRVISGVVLSDKKHLRRFFANAIHAMKLMKEKAD